MANDSRWVLMKLLPSQCILVAAPLALALGFAGPVQADAGAARYDIQKGTVHDLRTKLTWQQAVPSGVHPWADASTLCTSLDLDGKGWRLPSVTELETLIDESRSSPAIDPVAFP